VFRNKLNKQGEVVRNNVRFVAQGYSQQKGIDYTETFVHAARLEAIRLLILHVVHYGITLYQIDIKSAFWMVSFLKKFMLDNLLGLKI